MAKKVTPKTKSEIVNALAESIDITKKQAITVYETLLKIAYEGAKTPEGIMLPGLGKLVKVKQKARDGRNPQTGEKIRIKAKTAVKFRLSKTAKDAVLGK